MTRAAVHRRYAAVIIGYCNAHYSGRSSSVAVFDLRTGRQSPTPGGEQAGTNVGDEVDGLLNDLVININGEGDTAVHAIESNLPPGSAISTTKAVLASTGSGVQTVTTAPATATATTLSKSSLTGTILSYTDNSARMSIELP